MYIFSNTTNYYNNLNRIILIFTLRTGLVEKDCNSSLNNCYSLVHIDSDCIQESFDLLAPQYGPY